MKQVPRPWGEVYLAYLKQHGGWWAAAERGRQKMVGDEAGEVVGSGNGRLCGSYPEQD